MILPSTTEKRVYLKPGEFYFSDDPSIVTTILGSCVSVTMFNAEYRCGAICHAVLPEYSSTGESFRYVNSSIRTMVQAFQHYGIDHAHIEVKLFGGSDVLPVHESRRQQATVGKQNIDAALRTLEREHLRLAASDLGGIQGRKILFNTHTGEILLKRVHQIERSS